MKYLRYLKYVLSHKWYVFKAAWRIGAPLWRAVIHDWSKFTIGELIAYANHFYGSSGDHNRAVAADRCHEPGADAAFDRAWLGHIHRNPHHWQHFVIPIMAVPGTDVTGQGSRISAEVQVLEMPEHFVREMVADWHGAGIAQGRPDTRGWYGRNKDRLILHPETRSLVESLLDKL